MCGGVKETGIPQGTEKTDRDSEKTARGGHITPERSQEILVLVRQYLEHRAN